MKLRLRTKLFGIVALSAFAISTMVIVGYVSTQAVNRELERIEERIVPRVALRPRLQGELERLSRAFQDAVAAQDAAALNQASAQRDTLLLSVKEAEAALDPALVAELRPAIREYFTAAHEVSKRLIAGETGDSIVTAMKRMQQHQAKASELTERITALGPNELEGAFARAVTLQDRSFRLRLATSLTGLFLVVLLTFLLSRQILRSMHGLSEGFDRFGSGALDQPIVVQGDDELAHTAKRANEMAASLKALGSARERTLWLNEGVNGLSLELRGELSAEDVASRAAGFLARYLNAPASVLYYLNDSGRLELLGRHAALHTGPEGETDFAPSFLPGDGLVGQALREGAPRIVESLPDGYLKIRSGLGETSPRMLVLAPLTPSNEPKGVLELAFLGSVPEGALELIAATQGTIAIAIEMARSRHAQKTLLTATQQQAARLAMQEEELRANNEELESQGEELRQINEELTQQTDALDEHRKVLEQRNHELEDARKALELRAGELATMSAYKSQFLTNMSHELRTPLNSMLLLSNLLSENQAGNLTEQQTHYCKTIHSAGQDLLALINQVLDLAKVEAGKIEITIEPVDLRELIDHVISSLTPIARGKGLELLVDIGQNVPERITSDRQRLLQILNNLIANAIKFTEQGSVTLRVQLRAPAGDEDSVIAFEVTDTGPGIAPEHQERIFGAFEQADASIGRRHGGTGLGLAISRELSELLGGTLRLLRSAPGHGSTFVCELPASGPQPEKKRAARKPVAAPSNGRPKVSAPTSGGLLVIEDDAAFAQGLSDMIRDQGHEVFVASTGEQGLALAKQHRPRGIILDVMLPDIDGWEVLERLQADPETAAIPVHCVTAVDAESRAFRLGALGYVRKPAGREELLSVIDALAPRRKGGAPRILIVEDDVLAGESLMVQLAKEHVVAERVATATAAHEALRARSFDCLVVDLGLPDMDGLELLERLSKEGSSKLPSVIVYTARALTAAETRRLEAYTDTIVIKEGASAERLLREIRSFAGRLSGGARKTGEITRPLGLDADVRGRKVLVVDDDMRTVYALSALLRAKGFTVEVADTGRVALEVLAKHPDMDAVLMDIMMPEMDGYTAMQEIRKEQRFATLPIIALTAKAMKGDEERCLAAGATAYIPKPVDSERVLGTLRSLLASRP